MSKETLGPEDVPTYYWCENKHGNAYILRWTGDRLVYPDGTETQMVWTNFKRVYTTEEVEELRKALAEKGAEMEAKPPAGDSVGWYFCEQDWSNGSLYVRYWTADRLIGGANHHDPAAWKGFQKLYTEEEVSEAGAEIRKLRAELDEKNVIIEKERRTVDNLADKIRELKEQLEQQKANPRPLRKAEIPDCVGIWFDSSRDFWAVEDEADIANFHEENGVAPYYYYGPLMEIPQDQQPLKVVTVRCKATGKEFRAIPSLCQSVLAILNDDGSFRQNDSATNWDEVVK